jgi:hypothetical protein
LLSPSPLKTALSSPFQYGTNGIWNKNARGVIPLAFDFFQDRYRSKTYLSATWWQQPLMKKAAFSRGYEPSTPRDTVKYSKKMQESPMVLNEVKQATIHIPQH